MNDFDIYKQGILIIEDEKNLCLLYEEILKEEGFKNIYWALRGLEGINILQEKGEDIAVVILDIKMPEMSGLEVVQNLTNIYDGIVGIIFNTAYQSYKDDVKEIRHDCILNLDYLVKSSDIQPLVESVKRNIKLVLKKREKARKNIFDNIFKNLNTISSNIEEIRRRIEVIEKRKPSLLADIGKDVIITIILAIFVICALYFGLGDFLKSLIK